MKKFLFKIFIFCFSFIFLCAVALFFVPDRKTRDSLLAAVPDKNALLAKSTSPKIILVGGSNVSFGFNSQKIIDAYHLPVVNTGVTVGLGLKFMINDVKRYINKSDIIILAVEYQCYEKSNISYLDGEEALIPVLFDIYPKGKNDVDFDQGIHLLQYIPHYSFSKLKPENFFSTVHSKKAGVKYKDFYGRYSFNQYGDTYVHWTMPNVAFPPVEKCTGKEQVNPDAIQFLKKFKGYVTSKGARLIMIPPAFQETSFKNQQFFINKVVLALNQIDLPFVTDPSRYEFADGYFFNNPYHLNKPGVDKRTDMVIEDLSKTINH